MLHATASNHSVLMIEAVAAAKLGQKGLARRLFNEIVEKDPHSEHALLWLAALADTPDESIRALEQVLLINPQNEQAIRALTVQKEHQTARPTQVPLPPATHRALAAGPFLSPSRRLLRPNEGQDVYALQHGISGESPAKPPAQFQRAIRKIFNCPICQAEHLAPPRRCNHCGCFLSLDNPAQIAENRGADEEILNRAVESWKSRLAVEPLDANLNLARALLSLNRSAEALTHLTAASKIDGGNSVIRKLAETLKARKLVVTIDDSQTIRKLVSVHLERRGYRVLALEDGLSALSKFEIYKPDLVLLDITLPKVDGYEICRILRKHQDLKRIPVIMLSGNCGFFDKIRARLAGANDYLIKPFDVIALSKALDKHLPLPKQ